MIIPPCLCWSSASVPVCFRTGWLDCCSLTLYCAYPRTSPCLGRSPLVALPDVGYASLCSFHRFSPSHRRFDVLHAVLVPVLLYFVLLATGSLAVVLCRILTTCSLAVVPSELFFLRWLFGCGVVSDPFQRYFVVLYSFLDASSAPPTPLLSIAPFVIVGSR